MGVDRTDYIIFGWKMPDHINKNFEYNEVHESYINGVPEVKFTIINDGMSGEYTVFGLVINRTDEYDTGFVKLDFDISPETINEMILKYHELFGEYPMERPCYLAFPHYW